MQAASRKKSSVEALNGQQLFDVILIFMDKDGRPLALDHLPNAF
jgi:hypothetical protein